jgi:hypothetical protein
MFFCRLILELLHAVVGLIACCCRLLHAESAILSLQLYMPLVRLCQRWQLDE